MVGTHSDTMSGSVTTWSLPTTACWQVTWKSVRALCSEAGTVFHQFLRIGPLAIVRGGTRFGKDIPLTFPPTAKTCSQELTHLDCAAPAIERISAWKSNELQACLLERNQHLPGSRTGKIHKVEPGSASLRDFCRQLETWCLFRQSCPRNQRDARITYTAMATRQI